MRVPAIACSIAFFCFNDGYVPLLNDGICDTRRRQVTEKFFLSSLMEK